jgi:site-specific DNA-methyltransferase (adenine-specific)
VSHIVHLGDCLDPVTGLASLADKSVDHVICDPPYEAEAHTLQRRCKKKHDRGGDVYGVADSEPLPFPPITQEDRDEASRVFGRLTRRWVVVFCQVEAVSSWRNSLANGGLLYKRAGLWLKPNGQPQLTGDRPGMGYESIVFAHAVGRSTWHGGGKHGIWSVPKEDWKNEIDDRHPTQKPVSLIESLIRDFTDPGDLVLDPFAGSGTTGVACKRLGRRFIGWEKDPKYHAIAQKRIDATHEQLELSQPKRPKAKQGALL